MEREDLKPQIQICLSKLLESYKTLLRRSRVPIDQQQSLEDALHSLSIQVPAESILSFCRELLDIIQELRLRKFCIEEDENFS
jgi:hypothetical protein